MESAGLRGLGRAGRIGGRRAHMNVADHLFGKFQAPAAAGFRAQFPVYVPSGPQPRVGGAADVLLPVSATDTDKHDAKV